jgi:hypothetical protein
MFRAQNQLEPGRLVPYETLMNLPPNPTPPIPQNTGDNEPSPPQEIKEPDNVRDINDPRTPANQVTPDISELPPDIFSGQAGPSTPQLSAAPRRADNPLYEVGEEERINALIADIKQRPTRTGILGNALAVAGGIGKGALSLVRGVNVDAPDAPNVPYMPVRDLLTRNLPIKDLLNAFPVAPAGVLNVQNRPNLSLLDNNVARRKPVSADDNDQVINADMVALRAAQAESRRLQEAALGEVTWLTRKRAAASELRQEARDIDLAERAQDLAERRQQLRERQAAFEKSKKPSASPLAAEPEEEEEEEEGDEAPEEEKYLSQEDIQRRYAREAHEARLQQNPFDVARADEENALKFIQNIRNGKRPLKEDPVREFDMKDKRLNEYFHNPSVNFIASDIKAKAANKTALQIALSRYFKNLIAETFPNSIMNDYLYLIAKLTPASKGGMTEAEGGFPKTMPANSPVKINYLLEWLDYSFGRDRRGELGINEAWTPELLRLKAEMERQQASERPEAEEPASAAKVGKKASAGEGRKRKTKKATKSTKTTKNSKSLDAQILSLLKE